MFAATLSRWTMSYFAAALIFLVLGEIMMVLGYGYPVSALEAPETLALVHVVVLGWLSLLMTGALLQFVPVLVGRPLSFPSVALPALLVLITGIASLTLGFVSLSGAINLPVTLLPVGAAVSILGFSVLGFVFAATLWHARPLPLPARFVAVGLAALFGTMLLGGIYAGVLSGLIDTEAAIDLTIDGLSLHASLGLCGWLSFTTMGVSYRLLTMFMLSPDKERTTSRLVFVLGALCLGLLAVAVPVILAGAFGRTPLLLLAVGSGAAVVAIYVGDILRIYRERRRKAIELNSRASIGAFASLIAATALFVTLLAIGRLDAGSGAVIYLVAFGWLTGMGLAQLYKIVPFMTWLECYGPALGRVPTPRVQDLVVEASGLRWFRLYYLTVAVGTLALLIGSPDVFRLASLGQLIAVNALVLEFVRTRWLINVPAELRLPDGLVRPGLFLPSIPHGGSHEPRSI
ncbi:hypothetical protein PWG15_32320 (plasmid) [Ensifer adhaerens]|uniref:hypothetical protein n=1 Tax=Ensifer adhaerens TaxID=106592 RepID=UPI0023A92047|nr:hypothetical protein [Ensifer adhaerens]WDZ80107.1 hypothetical protein PWG15_32320 [Ensifer adhaerens]